MKNGGSFAKALVRSRNTFEGRFSRTIKNLRLGELLCPEEVSSLYTAAFYAAACNIAINGLGGFGGEIWPEMELNRISLERAFMASRDEFCGTAGWKLLRPSQKTLVKETKKERNKANK